jgi:hypothetical protein
MPAGGDGGGSEREEMSESSHKTPTCTDSEHLYLKEENEKLRRTVIGWKAVSFILGMALFFWFLRAI